MNNRRELTHDEIRRLFSYEELTGILVWKEGLSIRAPSGRVAGTMCKNGYVAVGIRGVKYLAHRVIWNYMSGAWPEFDIDHIDGDRSNNRFSNLRDVATYKNMQNLKRSHLDNNSGLLGVERHRNKWSARICVQGKKTYLGTFVTKEEAHAAYVSAKRMIHVCGTL